MVTVLLVIHLLIAITMVGLILLQKTEGNASGAGFSASASVESLMRPRARPNPIGRATAILGLCFFVTSISLAVMARPVDRRPTSIMSEPATGVPTVPKINDGPAAPPPAPAGPAVPNN